MFLEKLAKLYSKVNAVSQYFRIEVYDDEDMRNKPIMWLTGDIDNYGKKIIKVDVVDFDDELFFKLPENRQDACSVVLFKAFIKWYNENYGRNTDEWCPVSTTFANYDLQEKFKKAIEKGIFPKESMDYVEETTKNSYDSQQHYNMDNRKLINDVLSNPEKYYPGYQIQDSFIMNIPLSKFVEITKQINPNLKLSSELVGYIDRGNVFMKIPFNDNTYNYGGADTEFYYDQNNKIVDFLTEDFDFLKSYIYPEEVDNIKNIFDEVTHVAVGRDVMPVDKFYERIQEEKTITSRLKKG